VSHEQIAFAAMDFQDFSEAIATDVWNALELP
jgi:hypothetical protein